MKDFNLHLHQADQDIFSIIEKEKDRQQNGLELIASENYCSQAIRDAQGSILTNKYAEGYPKKRYYDGCEFVDQIEGLAIERAKKLFSCKYANVQPHSGSQANMAAYLSCLSIGDKILGMNLSEGGHLTHGSPVNFSGKLFEAHFYGLDKKTQSLDYDHILDLAKNIQPNLIIAGASAYPRIIDFKIFREIADRVDAKLLVDMAHISGLVATGKHPSPLEYADIVTSTTHKTLRGPRGGIILSNDENIAKKINSQVFPGIQGGPLEHVIAAKAVCFGEALKQDFKDYIDQVVNNAKIMAKIFLEEGISLVTGGTDNHLILLETDNLNLSGKEASLLLEKIGITCNKNMVPNDKRSPFVTSGVRLGTPAITTRGFQEKHTIELTNIMVKALKDPHNDKLHKQLRQSVKSLCSKCPLEANTKS